MIKLLLFIISIAISKGILFMVQKITEDQSIKYKYILNLAVFIVLLVLYKKFNFSNQFFIYSLLLITLILMSVIDYKTKYVYSIISYPLIAVGIILKLSNLNFYITQESIITLAIIIILIISALFGKFGWGDIEVYLICFLYFNSGILLSIIFISMMISLCIIIIKIAKDRKCRGTEIAFVPYITLATIVNVFFII